MAGRSAALLYGHRRYVPSHNHLAQQRAVGAPILAQQVPSNDCAAMALRQQHYEAQALQHVRRCGSHAVSDIIANVQARVEELTDLQGGLGIIRDARDQPNTAFQRHVDRELRRHSVVMRQLHRLLIPASQDGDIFGAAADAAAAAARDGAAYCRMSSYGAWSYGNSNNNNCSVV